MDVCEISHHVAQPHEESLKIGIDIHVLLIFSQLTFLQLLLVLQSFRRQSILASLFEVLEIDALLLSFVDLLHAFAAIDQVEHQQHCILEIDLV